jgi:hypothetical protein
MSKLTNEDQQLYLDYIATLENDLIEGIINEDQFSELAQQYRENNLI